MGLSCLPEQSTQAAFLIVTNVNVASFQLTIVSSYRLWKYWFSEHKGCWAGERANGKIWMLCRFNSVVHCSRLRIAIWEFCKHRGSDVARVIINRVDILDEIFQTAQHFYSIFEREATILRTFKISNRKLSLRRSRTNQLTKNSLQLDNCPFQVTARNCCQRYFSFMGNLIHGEKEIP